MRDRDHGALVGIQKIAQPLDRVQIQMVGRLVEQKDVRIFQNDAREVDAGFLAAGEHLKLLCAHVAGDFQTVAHLVHLDIQRVAAERFQLLLECAVAREQDGVRAGLHLLFQLGHLLPHCANAVERRAEHLLDGRARLKDRNLVDDADCAVLCDGHRAGIIGDLAGQDAEQGGLARAVRTDDCHLFAGEDIERDVTQNLGFPEKFI